MEQARLFGEPPQRAGETVDIAWLEEETVPLSLDEFGDATDVRGDDRHACQKRLADDKRTRLGPDRRHDQHIQRTKRVGHALPRLGTPEVDAWKLQQRF